MEFRIKGRLLRLKGRWFGLEIGSISEGVTMRGIWLIQLYKVYGFILMIENENVTFSALSKGQK